jgi:AhpD family alkylhydroperoxidase
MQKNDSKNKDILALTREFYARAARSKKMSRRRGVKNPEDAALELGYSMADLRVIPKWANTGLLRGNPLGRVCLNPGDKALILGSGGGLDVFVAAGKVGPSGKIIGVDMTYDMIMRARENGAVFSRRTGLDNFEFRLGDAECPPVAGGAFDVVVSNGAVNLSASKERVFKEIFRALKPGGRAVIAELMFVEPTPPGVDMDIRRLAGSAGPVYAMTVDSMINAAGFAGCGVFPQRMPVWWDLRQDSLHLAILKIIRASALRENILETLILVAEKPAAEARLDGKTMELVAAGAAVAAHCQRGFDRHRKKALALGASEADIMAAAEIGKSAQLEARAVISKHILGAGALSQLRTPAAVTVSGLAL